MVDRTLVAQKLTMLLLRQTIFCSLIFAFSYWSSTQAQDVFGCGGFVQSDVDINYSLIQVQYTCDSHQYKTKGYKTLAQALNVLIVLRSKNIF